MFSHSIKVSAFATILAKHYNDTLSSFITDPTTKKKCETVCKKYGDVYGSWSSYTTTSCSPLGDTCERILVYY